MTTDPYHTKLHHLHPAKDVGRSRSEFEGNDLYGFRELGLRTTAMINANHAAAPRTNPQVVIATRNI